MSKPSEEIITDVSCERCRKRRVKCSRTFPRCTHCTTRRESCSLASWKSEGESVEKGKVQSSNTSKRKLPEHKSTSPIINVPSSRSTRSRTVPEYDPDSDEAETFDSPPLAPTPATMTTSTTAQNQTRTSPSQHLVSPSPSASRQTFASPPGLAHQLTPHSVLPPLHRSTSQSSQWRKAMCKAFVEGDIALRGLHSQEFDFASLATKLTASCPTSPESSCIFFPSASWTYTDIITFPDSTQAIEALSNYFQRLEASLRLFPTNQSRQFLYEGCQQWWATGSCSGGLDWQALYLATTASSAVVSSDDQFSQLAQGWMYLAGRMVLSDQRFASNPNLTSLRTILLILHSSLLGGFRSLNTTEILAYLPVIVSVAFKLELNIDLAESSSNASIDDIEERRGLWWHIIKLETVWRPLLQSTYPAIDLSLCTTRLPFYFTSPVINTIAPIDTSSRSSIDEVVRLLSKLSRLVISPFAPPVQELQHLSSELMSSERALAVGDQGIIWKTMVYHGILSIQSVGDETSGMRIMEETEWAQRNLLDLVGQVTSSDQIDRLPILLYVLQGAVMAAIRLPTLSTTHPSLSSSLSAQLHGLSVSLRTTPWPAYMHQTVKRGVVIIEHLSTVCYASNAAVDPSLSDSSPGSSKTA